MIRKLILASLAALMMSGCTPMSPFRPVERFFLANTDQSEIREAVAEAAAEMQWKVAEEEPNRMLLSFPSKAVSNYRLVIEVTWTHTSLQARYYDSTGLRVYDNCGDSDTGGMYTIRYWGTCINSKPVQRFNRLMDRIAQKVHEKERRQPLL